MTPEGHDHILTGQAMGPDMMGHMDHMGHMGMSGHHVMAGLPTWALLGAMGAVLAISALGLWRFRHGAGTGPRFRLEVTRLAPIRWLLRQRWLQFALQVPLVGMLFLLLYAGFYGTPVADRNISTVMTWSIWWILLILDILLLGRMWCLVCPWEALAAWTRRLAFWRRTEEPLALNLKWPRWLRNVYPATFLFIGLTWLELGWGVTMNPRATAALGLLMVLLAVVPALFFEKRAFCRYGCLIGRVVGLYSTVAPVEIRSRDQDVCRSCKSKSCLTGNDRGYPCPTGQCLAVMDQNTYCTMCTECFKSCPHDNVALNLRSFCTDLHKVRKPRRDEAVLAVVLVALTSFHGLTMTPTWNSLLSDFMMASDLSRIAAFSVLMVACLLVPFVVFFAIVRLATWIDGRLPAASRQLGRLPVLPVADASARRRAPAGGLRATWRAATAYAYPLIAIALMYHLAHNAGHFLMEGATVVPVLSDPLGTGADYLGTADFRPRALGSMTTVWTLMIGFVLIGHIWAVRAMSRAHENLTRRRPGPTMPWRVRAVAALFPLLLSCANLWLLAQPMEMRTGM